MSVVITTYTLAGGFIEAGMNWWQAMITILLGNTIVLLPMTLNAHAGTKYGVSFPVLCRASCGVKGANVPAIINQTVSHHDAGRHDLTPLWLATSAGEALPVELYERWKAAFGVGACSVRLWGMTSGTRRAARALRSCCRRPGETRT